MVFKGSVDIMGKVGDGDKGNGRSGGGCGWGWEV